MQHEAGFKPLSPTAAAGLRPLPTRQEVTKDGRHPAPTRDSMPVPPGPSSPAVLAHNHSSVPTRRSDS
jgi:hypothetical protein